MKKILILVASAALAVLPMQAQQPQGQQRGHEKSGWSERMQAEKVAFLTQYVGLTESEAQAFWPVYNAMEEEGREYAKAEREAFKALNKAVAEKAEAAEIGKLTKAYIEASGKGVDKQKYFAKFSKILAPEKVAKVFLSEERFRRQQISQLRGGEGHHGGPQGGRPGGQKGPRPEGQGQRAPKTGETTL